MEDETNKNNSEKSRPRCGIIMPISPIDGCDHNHWVEILSILKEVAAEAGFEPNLVSDADDIGIIQKRIIQNVYNNEIIICDVSCKNPNVMFELGMRLAFDRPTVIIKDDRTDYSFDTGVIEHIGYPRDLRFHKILEFKETLQKKLHSTFAKSISDSNYSPFLKNFGEYKIAHLQEKEISSDNFILSSLEDIKEEMKALRKLSGKPIVVRRGVSNEELHDFDTHSALVKKYYREYLNSNNVRRMSDLALLRDDLVDFIASKHEIRKKYDSELDCRLNIDKILFTPEVSGI